ncbi:MAG TPA: DUF4388 domain-containing protein [Thermoanaerobaculia bacterium]|nr:DUF4388 domain-containing protein [Thermoanaerobaculia bacterium]
MGVSGNLKTMQPGDLLQWLSLGQKTGTLLVANKSVEKRIFFKGGRVISSASNDPRDYLGQFLISHGYLTEQELMKAMEVQQQSGILLGKILVMIEVISETDLLRLMRLKAEEEIYDIFLWREGDFKFIDDELPSMEMIPLQVDVTGIIMEGTRRVDEWQRIRELIPHDVMIPIIARTVPNDQLNEQQQTIVNAIDGKRTIAEIELEARTSLFGVCSTLHKLARDGYVRMTEPGGAAEEKAPFEEPAPPAETDEVAGLLTRAQQALKGKDYDKAQRLLKAAENLDPSKSGVRSAIKGAEAVILADLYHQGITESKVPRIAKPISEITEMNFTPNEGFILSRINGQWNLGALMKISPIRESEAMLIFYRLWKDGIIAFD